MTEQPRDWDKEMADIDRLIQASPPAPGRAPGPAQVPAKPAAGKPPVAREPAPARRAVAGTWARALAGAVLAGAMTQWPYAHGCGGGLLLYTLAAAAVTLAGGWGAVAAWRSRLAAAHILSLVVIGWGFGLLAAIVLPRIGYAAVAQTWLCP